MKRKLFIGVLVLFFNVLTYSQTDDDFTYAAEGVDGSEYYYYIEKINDFSKDVWIKSTKPLKTIKNKKGKYIKTGGGYEMSFFVIYCEDRKFDIIERNIYDKAGNIIDNQDLPLYNQKVIPGSVMSGLLKAICN